MTLRCRQLLSARGWIGLHTLPPAAGGEKKKNNSEICTCTGWIISVFLAARAQSLHAIEPARLCRAAQMGVWGDGCCQLTDQAVGRWSHCYSPHRHVGHVRHVPWRHTRAGWCCVLRFWCLLCIILPRRSENMHRGGGSLLGWRCENRGRTRRGAVPIICW